MEEWIVCVWMFSCNLNSRVEHYHNCIYSVRIIIILSQKLPSIRNMPAIFDTECPDVSWGQRCLRVGSHSLFLIDYGLDSMAKLSRARFKIWHIVIHFHPKSLYHPVSLAFIMYSLKFDFC